jgi:hypothetical protein
MLDRLSLEDFLPLVGTDVEVTAFGRKTQLRVREAAAIKSPSPRASMPFHLVLVAPSTWRLPQGLYRIAHPRLGELELFTVPIGPDGGDFCYEIIFN